VLPLFAFRNLLLSLLLFISVVVALVYFLAQKRNPFVDPGHPTFIRHQSHYFDYVKLLLPFLTVLFAHPLPDPTFSLSAATPNYYYAAGDLPLCRSLFLALFFENF